MLFDYQTGTQKPVQNKENIIWLTEDRNQSKFTYLISATENRKKHKRRKEEACRSIAGEGEKKKLADP